ncbi:glutathione S-transferase family protein [Methylonatrum kenyense]|uniref:glutathione S-transferase family protein n=1 Tax=Methylonatrum kenyense TaxID=455253 RepID=UPI0020C00A77|nr:glutathione S-transferase family protein [Methylonatrum kenyense]MCK8515840.1 glutathione S-transferase family protein [Methylonatrum kenyense]
MPGLVNGKWVKGSVAEGEIDDGAFRREPTRFRDWITPDGSPGPDDRRAFPAEPGRYQLFVAYLCPWASRALILRKLKGLGALIPVSVADAVLGEEGWTYAKVEDAGPRLGAIDRHYQLYTATDPGYSGKVSVPVLWDREQGRIVNNESADIVRILNTAFDHLTGNDLDFYPEPLRHEIDAWNALIYETLNNGVYRAGFAKSQAHYDAAVSDVFETLDRLECQLNNQRYLAGHYLTEADWRLFVTLVRFDAAYHGAFKCNIRRLEDYPNLSNYLRELYQWPGVRETVNLQHIKKGYYSITAINPTRIVPSGPVLDFDRPHDRDRLEGQGVWRRSSTCVHGARRSSFSQ